MALLSVERLRDLLNYDPETGVFTWRVDRGGDARAGAVAGNVKSDGYRRIKVGGVRYRANRLAWFWMNGEWPSTMVDHKDTDPSNDRFDNLREATGSQNNMNARTPRSNTSGFKGVCLHRTSGRWKAQIQHAGQKRHIGYFGTAQEAHTAYCAAAMAIDPNFARPA